MAITDRADRGLGALQALLASALGVVEEIVSDPLVERVLRAFLTLPTADRESVVRVLERDANWCRISQETYPLTRIRARANPYASLYVHVFDQTTGQPVEPEPSLRDINLIRFGVQRLARLLPLLVLEDVHTQWTTSMRELIRASDAELRALGTRLAREVLALLDEVDDEAEDGAVKATGR
jgi:hypothetical protein